MAQRQVGGNDQYAKQAPAGGGGGEAAAAAVPVRHGVGDRAEPVGAFMLNATTARRY